MKKKKWERICRLVDFSDSADHTVKIKENEKRDEYLQPIVTGTLETISKEQEIGLERTLQKYWMDKLYSRNFIKKKKKTIVRYFGFFLKWMRKCNILTPAKLSK